MYDSPPIRVALLGAGRVAQHYKKILDTCDITGYAVVGVCDINPSAAEPMAHHWSCPAFDSLATMIAQAQPDLVLVLTPSGLHFEHARTAILAGCHVLVEKPVTMIPSDAQELMLLAEHAQRMIGVAFQNRLNPAICCLKDALDANRFGVITTATIRLRWCRTQDYYEDGWHGTWAQDGGVINQQAIHHVDALNWLLGPVDEVCATLGNRLNRLEAEDTLVAVLRFANGALGTIEATTAVRPRDIEASLSVVGEKGLAVIGGIALNKVDVWEFVSPRPEDAIAPTKYSQEVPNGYGLSHGTLLQQTFDRLRQGSIRAVVPVENCVSTSELIHALYCSHETGCWVSLKDRPISNQLGRLG